MKYMKRFLVIILIALLSIPSFGCSNKSDTIKIATKPMTEQFILGEMIKLLIEDNTDLNVEITKGIGGGTSNIHPAIVKGDFDLYPEYTGTGWSFVLKEDGIPDDETLYKELQEKYKNNYDLSWIGLYGFNMKIIDNSVKINAPLYGIEFNVEDIEKVEIVDKLKVKLRINGIGMDEYSVGNFNVEGYGKCKLYIYNDVKPYILIKSNDEIIFINGENEEETLRYYNEFIAVINKKY